MAPPFLRMWSGYGLGYCSWHFALLDCRPRHDQALTLRYACAIFIIDKATRMHLASCLHYCALRPGPHIVLQRQAVDCWRAAHKAEIYRGFRSLQVAVLSAGTNTPSRAVFGAVAIGTRVVTSACCRRRIPRIERRKPCKFLQSCKANH